MAATSKGGAVRRAAAELAAGGFIVVVDDETRENEADLVGAAELMTVEQMAFMVGYSTGIVCVPMSAERCDSLRLPQMVEQNTDDHGTAFTVSVDHVDAGTGVSAAARVMTVRALSDPAMRPERLRRPGHIFPLRARGGGTLSVPGTRRLPRTCWRSPENPLLGCFPNWSVRMARCVVVETPRSSRGGMVFRS